MRCDDDAALSFSYSLKSVFAFAPQCRRVYRPPPPPPPPLLAGVCISHYDLG